MPSPTTVADQVKERLRSAAQQLGTADPVRPVAQLLDLSFPRPAGAQEYAANALIPGAVPVEPRFAEQDPSSLRITIEPVPGASPDARRQEATRTMRSLTVGYFGRDALNWFDRCSEAWRGVAPQPRSRYGAWLGTAVDRDGLAAARVYYEMHRGQLDALPRVLRGLVEVATEAVPALAPVLTSIRCGRQEGSQRVTFVHRGSLRLADLAPLMQRLGLAHQLPSVMQVAGVALGGRFELPERSVLIGVAETSEGPELEIEVLLGMIPDLPPSFLDLLSLGLAERPRELQALGRWLRAFTPDEVGWPGEFSVMTIRTSPRVPARVTLGLRPVEFELRRRLADVPALQHSASIPAVM
jgi:hypothetical protein